MTARGDQSRSSVDPGPSCEASRSRSSPARGGRRLPTAPAWAPHLSAERQAEPLAVGRGQVGGRAAEPEPALLQDGDAVTQRLRLVQVVRREDDRPACVPREEASHVARRGCREGTMHPAPPGDAPGTACRHHVPNHKAGGPGGKAGPRAPRRPGPETLPPAPWGGDAAPTPSPSGSGVSDVRGGPRPPLREPGRQRGPEPATGKAGRARLLASGPLAPCGQGRGHWQGAASSGGSYRVANRTSAALRPGVHGTPAALGGRGRGGRRPRATRDGAFAKLGSR